MTYRTSFRHNGKGRVRLLLGEHASTALRILLNGEEAGVLGWEPYELELEGLRTGENELGIELGRFAPECARTVLSFESRTLCASAQTSSANTPTPNTGI